MPKGTDDAKQEVVEFLNELRVVLPGVQVLFAFLLTVPFSQRFNHLGGTDRGVYVAALLLAVTNPLAVTGVCCWRPGLPAPCTWSPTCCTGPEPRASRRPVSCSSSSSGGTAYRSSVD